MTENVPGVRSAAFGIWVGVGSRDETPAQAGAAHYLEHLLFKGTPTRSALDISASIDAVGGEMVVDAELRNPRHVDEGEQLARRRETEGGVERDAPGGDGGE